MRIRRPSQTVFDGMIEALSEAKDAEGAGRDHARPNSRAFILALPESPVGLKRAVGSETGRKGPYGDADAAEQPPCDPDSIAAELGLNRKLTVADITALRRAFALRNHPDRVPEAWRALATERMTIANRLLDAATDKLVTRR